ncbi:protein kinase C theta type-like [Rhinophrynus dorsalis]
MTCGQKATGYAGTEGYIAPEIQNGKRYNTAVDWYSFGAILYNMVTGEFPEESPSSQKLTFPSSVSSHTKDLIRKLLVKDPVRRQQVADTICSHPLFRSINWEDLQKGRIQPPFPKLMEKNKFYVAEESPFSSTDALEPPIASEDQQLFRGFSFMGSDL